MTADGLSFIQWFFPAMWSFFTSWHIPGTGVSPAGWLLFLLLAGIVLKIVFHILHSGWLSGGGN